MIVLGIDPGSRRCGFGAVAREGSRLRVVATGKLVPGDLPVPERLGVILDAVMALIERVGPSEVAVEQVFSGASARSALLLGQARGVVLAAAARAGLPVFEYAPAQVKLALTGHGRADKPQMMRMARALFGVQATVSDEADALALAVCHLAHRAARGRVAAAGGAPAPPRGRAFRSGARRRGAAR
ncbi:MAG TPA: crossover junction endodeoxyribonuclease RuvC [Anaeromyxobacteraceae bacterium]|nr:crossover junction endodeoxyribonuclease RuvC [Anaeromyxobacteraceae bacterium]